MARGVAYYRSRRTQDGTLTHNQPQVPEPAPPEPPPAPQIDYPAEVVPDNARDVVAWLHDASGDADAQARARAAVEAEDARDSQRKTVLDAVGQILG